MSSSCVGLCGGEKIEKRRKKEEGRNNILRSLKLWLNRTSKKTHNNNAHLATKTKSKSYHKSYRPYHTTLFVSLERIKTVANCRHPTVLISKTTELEQWCSAA